jgi:spore coat protein U-like protein
MKSFLLWCALLFSLGSLFSPLQATTCTVNSNGGINFTNAYDPTSSAVIETTGSISFTCNNTGLGDTVTLTLSTGSSGVYTNRTLVLGSQHLNYNLYVDTGYTEVFGNGTGGTYSLYGCYGLGSGAPCGITGGSPSGTTFTGPVYGKLPGGQNVGAGTYSDTLTATVTF